MPITAGAPETDGKNSDVKDQTSAKKSKGNSGNEKATETGKATSGSGNEGGSQRWVSSFSFIHNDFRHVEMLFSYLIEQL